MAFSNSLRSLQNVDLLKLCQQYETPLYVYDAAVIRQKATALFAAFQEVDVKIKYACKANSNLSILRLIKSLGIGLDVVSNGEFSLGKLAGFEADEMTYTPSGAPQAEINEVLAQGALLTIDSLPLLAWFGQTYGDSRACAIRIKPNISAGWHVKIMTGHARSKFGISILLLDEILTLVKKYQIQVAGIHQHTGSDLSDINAFLRAAEVIFDVAKQFPNLEFLDLGGGFKVSYHPDDPQLDISAFGQKIGEKFLAFSEDYGKKLQLWFEPGKFLISESGLLLTTATVVKNDPAATFVHVDTGLNHLIRPMMYGAYHQFVNISRPEGSLKKYDVVGYICETDTFATDRELPEVQAGDVLAIMNAGAYGYSMSSSYNSRPRPAEVLIDDGHARLIRRGESLEDLLKTQAGL